MSNRVVLHPYIAGGRYAPFVAHGAWEETRRARVRSLEGSWICVGPPTRHSRTLKTVFSPMAGFFGADSRLQVSSILRHLNGFFNRWIAFSRIERSIRN